MRCPRCRGTGTITCKIVAGKDISMGASLASVAQKIVPLVEDRES